MWYILGMDGHVLTVPLSGLVCFVPSVRYHTLRVKSYIFVGEVCTQFATITLYRFTDCLSTKPHWENHQLWTVWPEPEQEQEQEQNNDSGLCDWSVKRRNKQGLRTVWLEWEKQGIWTVWPEGKHIWTVWSEGTSCEIQGPENWLYWTIEGTSIHERHLSYWLVHCAVAEHRRLNKIWAIECAGTLAR